jgi:hypothetical protein
MKRLKIFDRTQTSSDDMPGEVSSRVLFPEVPEALRANFYGLASHMRSLHRCPASVCHLHVIGYFDQRDTAAIMLSASSEPY